MSYTITQVEGKTGIVESDTNLFIVLNKKSEKEIRAIARKLNLGSGFGGFTPSFVARGGYKYK